jgi:pilus assembly protein CpaF
MRLGDTLRSADIISPAEDATAPARPASHRSVRKSAAEAAAVVKPAVDPLVDLKLRAQELLFSRLGARLYDSSLSEEQLRATVVEELDRIVRDEPTPLTPVERHHVVTDLADDVLGYGPMQRFLADHDVSEIMVNGCEDIYVERAGRLHRTNARFVSDDHVRRVIDRIVSQVGRRIDESSPMVDARLPDGSRVNAVIPPLAVDGPSLTVRKFSHDPFQADDLVGMGTFNPETVELLSACVRGRLNTLVTGGTGTGKTTLLNVLSSFIPEDERVVTIEDSVELQMHQHHVVRLESRPSNVEGRGAVNIRDLVRNSLRMRPDRIIVGEVRGGEALDMLQAMNTGHDGSLSTVHANTPRDAISRLETMVLMAGMDLPDRAVREQIASALDLIVHLTRFRDGTRRVTHVTEVVGMEGTVVTLQDIFAFDYSAGVADDGRHRGTLQPTGIRPAFADRLADLGIVLPASTFGSPDILLGARRRST